MILNGFIKEMTMTIPVFHPREAAVAQILMKFFRYSEYDNPASRQNNLAKKEMENKTHRDAFGRWPRWGTNVGPTDDTAAAVAGKLMPVKAADASLDPNRETRGTSAWASPRAEGVHCHGFSVTSRWSVIKNLWDLWTGFSIVHTHYLIFEKKRLSSWGL